MRVLPSFASNSRSTTLLLRLFAVLAVMFTANLIMIQSASADMSTNTRLHNGNAENYCYAGDNAPGYYAKGMVWLSNQDDYYSEDVRVNTDDNDVRISIRGAVNACRTTWSGDRDIFAMEVTTAWLSGLSGNTLYRGRMPAAGNFRWTSEGGRLFGTLDISRVARCSSEHYATGRASETITIEITRRQQQRDIWGNVTFDSFTYGTERVPVNVSRTCPQYDYSLTPSIDNITDGAVIEDPNPSLPVAGSIRNNGPSDSRPDISYQITKLRYGPGDAVPEKSGGTRTSGSDPCTFFTGELNCDPVTDGTATGVYPIFPRNDVVNRSGTTSVTDYAVGTRICFAMSVNKNTHSSDDWRHSDLFCYVYGKNPKVNIIGGDLYVGRVLAGITAPVSTRVITENSTNATGTYGSWVEYAIAPTGTVRNTASGSAYVGGAPVNTSLLTFVNTGNTSATCGTSSGCYQHNASMPDLAARFRTTSATPTVGSGSLSTRPSGVYRTTGNIDIAASNLGAGRSVIINAGSSNVTISGNIDYASGPFTSASQIPQLVIIANNITIREGVERVNAWLIAPGTRSGTTVTGGVIRTCDVAAGSITSGICNRLLTVNGPVIANRLIMLRSGGSEPGNRRGEPAEVFNFRPDAYIWAMRQSEVGGRVTTVSTKELPPRY